MKKLSTLIISALTVVGIAFAAWLPVPVAAADCDGVTGAAQVAACSACIAENGSTWDVAGKNCHRANGGRDLNGTIHVIINVMLFAIGILAVMMIIYGGIRYTISRGEEKEIGNAKNTIMYSVIGLVVAIIAYAVVQWVYTSLQ